MPVQVKETPDEGFGPEEGILRRMPSAAYLSVLSRDSSFVLSFLPNPKSRRSYAMKGQCLFLCRAACRASDLPAVTAHVAGTAGAEL